MANTAGGDIQLSSGQGAYTVQIKRLVASGTTGSIVGGQPIKENGSNVGVVALIADGDGSTSQRIAGISKNQSTETSAAAGAVEAWVPLPGLLWRGKASVAANANTAALIDALKGKRVLFDLSVLSSGVVSIDTADADNAANGVVIAGGDFNTSTIEFYLAGQVTTFFV